MFQECVNPGAVQYSLHHCILSVRNSLKASRAPETVTSTLFPVCHLFISVVCVWSGFGAAGCDPRPVHGGWRGCPGSDQPHPEASQEGERPLGWDKTFSFPFQQSGQYAAETAFLIKSEALYHLLLTYGFLIAFPCKSSEGLQRGILFWKRYLCS